MAASPGKQAVQGRSIADPLKCILESYKKFVTWILEIRGLLPKLIRRLARCWLERDERRVDKDGAAAEGPPERLLKSYVRLQAYVLTAVTGLGYLALTWSTVVLLGGFVTLLGKKDFWCLTVISIIQAAKIFDTLQDDMVIYLLKSLIWFIDRWDYFSLTVIDRWDYFSLTAQTPLSGAGECYSILMMPIIMVFQNVVVLYWTAPLVGIVLSAWRLRWRDYGTSDSGDNSKANLRPALDIYYALVLLQGAFYLLWKFNDTVDEEIVQSVYRRRKKNAKWGKELRSKVADDILKYLLNTRSSYTKEPASLDDRTLITYAVGLLESESGKEYMSGARLLSIFIEQGEDVRSLLLLSRPKIQKLIGTLGCRGIRVPDDESQEIRLLAAKIVADVAGSIHLAQFPGAAQCIASLFVEDEDELRTRENFPVVTRSGRTAEGKNRSQEGDQEGDNETSSANTVGDACSELILQGLTILERLASNHHNCRDICNTPGLLSVITAPIYSDTLIKDIEVSACAEVAYRSFKVLHQLVITPGWTGRELLREVSSSNQAVSNLKEILELDTEASQELQMGAMEILTEMALDMSVKLVDETKENLIITRLLHIFLIQNLTAKMKIAAGRTLALLSSKRQRNSLYIITERHDSADRLTQIMFDDGNTDDEYKITAAEILVNLCTHSMLPEEFVKGTLLPKVLTRILPSDAQPQSSQRNICNCFPGICGDDEESQHPNHNIQNQQPTQENEAKILKNKLLEASLSLTLLIYDKMIYVDGFDAVFRARAPADQLVARLKTIVDKNCKGKATSVSLRIVKLCCQIAISMMQRQKDQYTAHFRDQKFVDSLSEATRIMSKLDSCMLVTAGTNNCRMKKNSRPLLYHLEKEVRRLVLLDATSS